jgi:hypothetical protein
MLRRQNKFSEDQIREENNNFGKVSNSSNFSNKNFSPIKIPILPNDFCSTSGDCSNVSNSDARFGTTFRAAIVSDQFPPSCECLLSVCWVKEPDKAPFPVRVPASATEFLGGPSADEVNYRRKRTRNASDLISTSLQEVPGLEESREPFSPPSSQNPGINPSDSASAS